MVGAGPRGGYNAKSGGRLHRRARAAVRRPPHRRRSRRTPTTRSSTSTSRSRRRRSSPTSSTPTSSATTCATRARTPSVDLAFTDGTYLTDLGASDQHGAILSPQGQAASKTLYTNQWNLKRSRIGEVAAGKTIDRILVAYDNPDGPADFGGWIDDLDIGPAKPRSPRAATCPTGSSRPAARTRAAASRAATTSRRPRSRTASTSGRRSPTRAR